MGQNLFNSIDINYLIYPLFAVDGSNIKEEIGKMPGVYRFSIDEIVKEVKSLQKSGINKILLFGVPDRKDEKAGYAYAKGNIAANAVTYIKNEFPDITVITDVCLCAYTTHGHCGIIKKQEARSKKQDLRDEKETLEALQRMAVSHAEAGADYVAPSAMMRGQVKAIRSALDTAGCTKTKIMGYSAKFASGFYGPFRDIADSEPSFGDRTGYQLDYADKEQAIDKIARDIQEGADIVMVKPALCYLDIINQAYQQFEKPLAAYNVSGEYSMIKYGAKLGFWDEKKIVSEILCSIKRAGADYIISYHSKDIAGWQQETKKHD